jgi:hypothetical protein
MTPAEEQSDRSLSIGINVGRRFRCQSSHKGARCNHNLFRDLLTKVTGQKNKLALRMASHVKGRDQPDDAPITRSA